MASNLKKIVDKTLPIVVIIGATGTGKSKLAIEIAEKFNGEIISADSMQVYKELDIITNKVTAEEQAQVPHHVIDYVSPFKHNYTVHDFRNKALSIIDNLLVQQKLPVIVGGTNYYIEALLWENLLSEAAKESVPEGGIDKKGPSSIEDSDHASLPSGEEKLNYNVRMPEKTSNLKKDENSACTSILSESSSSDGKMMNSKSLITSQETKRVESSTPDQVTCLDKEIKYAGVSSQELHRQLQEVDPPTAQRLHPNNRRKIIRALEVYESSGVKMSQLLDEQHSYSATSNSLSGPLRYPDPCIIWIQTEQTVLDERLDRRVDDMMTEGLLAELEGFHQQYNARRLQQNHPADYTLGIFQSIGFKEFHEYLILGPEDRASGKGRKLLEEGLRQQKLNTRKYARKQIKWIRSRFLKRGCDAPAVYAVDSTHPENWQQDAHIPAMQILSAVIKGQKPDRLPLPSEEKDNKPEHNRCDVCGGRVFVTSGEWKAHINSRKHKKMVARRHASHKVDEALKILHKKRKLAKTQSSDAETEDTGS